MENIKQPSSPSSESRRAFLKKSTLAAAAVAAGTSVLKTPVYGQHQAPALGSVLGANERLNIGFIGLGGQGFNAHLGAVKSDGANQNVAGVAVCDLYTKRREQAREALSLASADAYEDYERLLERSDIDAVFVGTVDHWHAKIAMDAMEAGKHVYCEKPMTRYLDEAFAVHEVAMRTGKKFQVGSQFCSEGKWHKAAELIRAGKIGQLVSGQDSYSRNSPDGEWNYEIDPDVTPQTVNWEKWLGPVSDRPFSANDFHRWRKYYPYCAGILGDLLAHRIHPLMIATGNPEWPRRVAALGTLKVTTDRDVRDNLQVLAEFPSGLTLNVLGSTINEQGLEQVIRGHEATLYFGGNSVELRPERPFADLVDREVFEGIQPGVSVPIHAADWYNAIRTDRQPNGNIDLAVKVQTVISMAEMSDRLGEMLFFDADTKKLTTGSGREIQPITYGSNIASR